MGDLDEWAEECVQCHKPKWRHIKVGDTSGVKLYCDLRMEQEFVSIDTVIDALEEGLHKGGMPAWLARAAVGREGLDDG